MIWSQNFGWCLLKFSSCWLLHFIVSVSGWSWPSQSLEAVYSSAPGFCSCPNGREANKSQILKVCTFNFYIFSNDFRKLGQELQLRNKISYSYMGRQYLQALHNEESLFTFLDNKNMDKFRSLISFLAPCTFSVPAKALQDPGTKQQGFCLGSWW